MAKRTRKCEYTECMLRDNNNNYILQFVYLLPATLVFILDVRQFTFFAIILYVAPIIIDTWCTNSNNPKLNIVIKAFFWVNLSIAVICFIGLSGIIENRDTYFVIGEFAADFSGKQLEKRACVKLFLADLAVPIMLYIGSPCKKNMVSKSEYAEAFATNVSK